MSKKTKKLSNAAAFPAAVNSTPFTSFAPKWPVAKVPAAPPHDTSHMSVLDPQGATGSMFMRTLVRALTTRRKSGSASEAKFCAWLTTTLGATMIDEAGNIHVDTRDDPTAQRTLFTAHTDTCARGDGDNVVRVSADGTMWYADTATNECLGADDGAGIALMAGMIDAGVKAYFLFPRGEEVGGVGSSALSKDMPELFKQFDRAIAFDRADCTEVITHQGGERGASDECGEALALALSSIHDDVMYLPSTDGVYTDTKEFFDLVPECFNIGVGYKYQHGSREQLDVAFLTKLAGVVCTIDWDALPTKRDPKEYDDLYGGMGSWPQRYDTHTKATHSTYEDLAWDDLTHAVEDAYKYRPALLIEWVSKHAAAHYDDPVKLSAANITLTLNRKADALIASDVLGWMEAESDWPSITPAEFAADVLEYVIN